MQNIEKPAATPKISAPAPGAGNRQDQRGREQRLRALELAVDLGKTAGWRTPGTTALVHAHEFAGFLADGTLPEDVKEILGTEVTP